MAYLSSANPVFVGQTSNGEAYHSDSRILLLDFSHGRTPTLAGIHTAHHTLE
jgi:hypothetical protein